MQIIGRGFTFDDLKVGMRFRTHRRTIFEADLAAFINLSWLTEELFAVEEDRPPSAWCRARWSIPSPKACCCRRCRTPGSRSSTPRST